MALRRLVIFSDPRVLFDGSQFIVTVDEINTKSGLSNVVYAVSNNANPTNLTAGSWQDHSVSTSINSTWSDQPLVAENGNYLYITTNQFTSSGQYSSDYMTIVDTSTNTVTYHGALNSWSYQPAQISDGSSADQYFVSHSGSSLYVIDANGIGVTSLASIGGLPNNGNFSASQYGTNYKLDAGDGRVDSAAYDATHNELYAVFEAQTSGSAPTVELVQFQPGSSSAKRTHLITSWLSSTL